MEKRKDVSVSVSVSVGARFIAPKKCKGLNIMRYISVGT